MRHVERGRGLVEDEQRRVVGERHRDHHALLHAARQLMRVALGGAPRAAPRGPAGRQPRVARRACDMPSWRSRSVAWSPTRMTGLSAVHRALEHHRDAPPAHLAPERRPPGSAVTSRPCEQHPAAGDARVPGQHPHDRVGEAGYLPDARLPDDAQRLARRRRWSNETPVRRRAPARGTSRTPRPGPSHRAAAARSDRAAHDSLRSRGLTIGSMASDRSMNVTAVMTIEQARRRSPTTSSPGTRRRCGSRSPGSGPTWAATDRPGPGTRARPPPGSPRARRR